MSSEYLVGHTAFSPCFIIFSVNLTFLEGKNFPILDLSAVQSYGPMYFPGAGTNFLVLAKSSNGLDLVIGFDFSVIGASNGLEANYTARP